MHENCSIENSIGEKKKKLLKSDPLTSIYTQTHLQAPESYVVCSFNPD